MKSFRTLALSGLAILFCLFLAACGGGSAPTPPAPPSPPTIISTTPPQGAINTPYVFQLGATGGTGSYTWSIAGGTLPPGTKLDTSVNQVKGKPTAFGSFMFTIKVTDGANLSSTADVTVNISGFVFVNCDSCSPGTLNLPYGTPGVPYSATLSAGGGQSQPPYTWCIVEANGACDNGSQGGLPPGLTLSTVNNQGIISGTPTTPGTPKQFTVQVTDSETIPAHGTAQLTLTIFAIGTTTLPNGTINVAYSQNVVATGGMSLYTWSVISGSLPPGLSLNPTTCINSHVPSCTISGTPTQLGNSQFTLQVADGETPPALATQALSINVQGPTLKVSTLALPAGTVSLAYSTTLQATGGIPPLTWCIKESGGACDNGSGGALPAGLSLDTSSGLISGTPTSNGKSIFIVQVTDSENPPQIALSQTPLSITVNPAVTNSLLHGNYAFSFSGYDSGTPVIMAGAFVADGSGNVTSGVLDRNDGSGEPIDGGTGNVTPQTLTTGSVYSLNADGTGTLTLVTSQGTYQFSVVVSGTGCTASASNSGCGRLIQRDANHPQSYGSGVLKVQNQANFLPNQMFPGNFAFQIAGTDSTGNRYAGAGAMGTVISTQVNIDCTANGWGLSGCPVDVNDAGSAHSNPMGGNFSPIINNGNGRGNFAQFTFPSDPSGFCQGTTGSPACSYAYYVVNSKEIIIISADAIAKPANLTLWSATRQAVGTLGWNTAALQGSGVVEFSAVDPNNGNPLADISAGLLVSDGQGNGTLTTDENKGGTLNLQQSSTGTYTVDNKTGRVALSGFATQFGTTPPVMYLFGTNGAFAVGTDTNVTSGVIEAQVGAPFNNSSVLSSYAGSSIWPALSGVTNSATQMFADGNGNINGSQVTSGSGGAGGPTNLNLTYLIDQTGRAVVQQSGNQFGILYVVSPNKVIMLPAATTDTGPALNVFTSGPAS